MNWIVARTVLYCTVILIVSNYFILLFPFSSSFIYIIILYMVWKLSKSSRIFDGFMTLMLMIDD